ncbi:PDZ domain-containing protein [Streptomyces sp. NPDC018352]
MCSRVRVLSVDPGSNTEAAGLLPGDRIIEVDG